MGPLKLFWLWIRRKLNLGVLLLAFHPKSIIVLDGWNRSFRANQSIDRHGNPIPWYTYAAIHFLEPRLSKQLRIFEYGCGNSTLYYAKHVAEIVAVESDGAWAKQIAAKIPTNTQVIFRDRESEFIDESQRHGIFDMIIIDGSIDRFACTRAALKALNEQGIIIIDNSDRPELLKCVHFLIENGFRELPFYGSTPITFVPSQTSILYRPLNCLNI